MKRNPVVPFAIIAIVGILAVIIISFVGVNQREKIASGGEEQNQAVEEGGEVSAPEDIFSANCASCHGADLSGGYGPDLTKIGGTLSEDEIKNIVTNGTDNGMPAQKGNLSEDEIAAIAKWLSEKK